MHMIMKKEYKEKRSFAHDSPLPLVALTLTGAYNTVHTATALRASAQIRRRQTSYAPETLDAIGFGTLER